MDSRNFHCDQYYSKSSTSISVTRLCWPRDAGDEIDGVSYAEELQEVHSSDDIYKIEKILAEKKENSTLKRKKTVK